MMIDVLFCSNDKNVLKFWDGFDDLEEDQIFEGDVQVPRGPGSSSCGGYRQGRFKGDGNLGLKVQNATLANNLNYL